MPTGIGIPPDANGNGTTPADVQAITAAKYRNAGIIGDGAVVQGQANWNYRVTPGAVLIDTGTGLAVEVPVADTIIAAPAAPTSGTATHTIFVRQLMPGSDGSSLASVGVTTGTAPANSVILDRRVVSANATATSSTTSNYDRIYAVPTSGSLGMLGSFLFTGTNPHTTGVFTVGSARFVVPTDRYVNLQLTETYSLGTSTGASGGGYAFQSIQFKVFVDDVLIKTWEVVISGMWATQQFNIPHYVTGGAHTVRVTVERQTENTAIPAENRYWMNRYGGAEKFSGTGVQVWDLGISR